MPRIVARPPLQQPEVRLLRRAQFPVQLRDEVMAPSLAQPVSRVGVELVVLIESFDILDPGKSRPRDAEGADAELHRLLPLFDAVVDAMNQLADVLPPPIRAIELSAGVAIFGVA